MSQTGGRISKILGPYFSTEQAAATLEAMRLLSHEELTKRLEIPRPTLAKLEVVDGVRLFDQLRAFIAQAVRANRGIVVHLFI